jgi:uncharacterized membrane protein
VFSNDFSGLVWFFPFPPLIIGNSSSAIWLFGFSVVAVVFCLILSILLWRRVKRDWRK